MAGRAGGRSVAGMTGRGVAVAVAVALAARPPPPPPYPDWRDPTSIGVAQEGVLRFPQALAYDASGVADPDRARRGPYVYVADQHSFFVQKFTAGGRSCAASAATAPSPGTSARPRRARARRPASWVASAAWRSTRAGASTCSTPTTRAWSASRRAASSRATSATFGSAPGQLEHGINGGLALLGDELYVGDQDNDRVQRFHLGADGRPDGPPVDLRRAGHARRGSSTSSPGCPSTRRATSRARRRQSQRPRPAVLRGRRVPGPGGYVRPRPGSSTRPTTPASTSPGGCSSPTTRTTASRASTRALAFISSFGGAGRAPGGSTTCGGSPSPPARTRRVACSPPTPR